MGVSFVPTALVTPFLVMGVGCDDVFVIINSYALAYCEPTPRDRCVVTFKDCGVSVILTTATNLIAFGVGCQSPYTSIRNFCLFSLNGLAFSLFFELTIFFAVLCLDAQREVERRSCFFKTMDPDRNQAIEENKNVATAVSSLFGNRRLSTFELVNYQVSNDWSQREGFIPKIRDESKLTLVQRFVDRGNWLHPPGHSDPMTEEAMVLASNHPAFTQEPPGNVGRQWRRFFSNFFCVILLNPITKIVVMMVFTFVAILAVRGIVSVEQGLELKDLSPDHSYLKVYDALYSRFFGGYDIPVYIFFPDPTPWWDPRVLRTLRRLDERLSTRPSTRFLNDPLIRMVDDPELTTGLNSGEQSIFESTLYEALSSSHSKYKQFEKDFAWEGSRLVSWKLTLLPAGMSTSEERAKWMRNMRDDCRSIGLLGSPEHNPDSYFSYYPLKAVAWNYMMLFYESDLQIMSSVVSSLTTAAISMLVVALILIPEVATGLMVIFVMSLIDLAVMGFMYYWHVKLNMISMITLVISIGFSIDYSAHICHTFTHCLGRTRNLRAAECVVLMGTPVFHGAASTIVGILVLGYSQSFIFRLFFKMMILVLSFGILHGLVLLPVLLSLFGKMPGPALTDALSQPPPTRFRTTSVSGSKLGERPRCLTTEASVSTEQVAQQHRRHRSLSVPRLYRERDLPGLYGDGDGDRTRRQSRRSPASLLPRSDWPPKRQETDSATRNPQRFNDPVQDIVIQIAQQRLQPPPAAGTATFGRPSHRSAQSLQFPLLRSQATPPPTTALTPFGDDLSPSYPGCVEREVDRQKLIFQAEGDDYSNGANYSNRGTFVQRNQEPPKEGRPRRELQHVSPPHQRVTHHTQRRDGRDVLVEPDVRTIRAQIETGWTRDGTKSRTYLNESEVCSETKERHLPASHTDAKRRRRCVEFDSRPEEFAMRVPQLQGAQSLRERTRELMESRDGGGVASAGGRLNTSDNLYNTSSSGDDAENRTSAMKKFPDQWYDPVSFTRSTLFPPGQSGAWGSDSGRLPGGNLPSSPIHTPTVKTTSETEPRRIDVVPLHSRQRSFSSSAIGTISSSEHVSVSVSASEGIGARVTQSPANSSFVSAVPSFSENRVISARSLESVAETPGRALPAVSSYHRRRLLANQQRLDLSTHILDCLQRSRLLEENQVPTAGDGVSSNRRTAARRSLRRPHSSHEVGPPQAAVPNRPAIGLPTVSLGRLLSEGRTVFAALSSAPVTPASMSQTSAPAFLVCSSQPVTPVQDPAADRTREGPRRRQNSSHLSDTPGVLNPKTPRLLPQQTSS
eukprot:Gregarina_sp_Poly_1__10082@NODE_681_length_6806_cov_40_998219_g514_i0_p1_GENE_NODE_681_length_6806_cov_40_998219_g514_i0NODE_681_length_6806_cov_40_998219_g514_i0_p1_ORF_typecomplete_len1300_score182_06Patched/PF02460_18/4e108Sterolsensing/PF12349_8/7_5e23Sterolsensing/PF12349_8/2_3e03Sterolsensing/PF12349_8/4_1e03Sterolsensing/PF12349_8/4_3e02MMPL/PF03176_15/3_1e05MMPL/PF03176_15/1_1e11ACR_tran/PF00873_19/2e06VIT1/PF01988_19/1_8e04VIT1/PF01988_19/0_32_NODE_681_length_6806_cov_40_998219_g514_i01